MLSVLRLFGVLIAVLGCVAGIGTFIIAVEATSLTFEQPNYPLLTAFAVGYVLTGMGIATIFFALAEIVERLRVVEGHTNSIERNEIIKRGVIRRTDA